jgi:kelch-like protein 8
MISLVMCACSSAGGFDDNAPLDSVERYNPDTRTWTPVVNMLCPRGGVGVAALGGRLYAVGGHDGTNYLSSVEEYDPCSDRYLPRPLHKV